MRTITATEASRGFSRLLDAVAAGERITVTRAGHRVATIIPPEGAATIGDIVETVRRVGPIDDEFAHDVRDVLAGVDMTVPDRWADE